MTTNERASQRNNNVPDRLHEPMETPSQRWHCLHQFFEQQYDVTPQEFDVLFSKCPLNESNSFTSE